MSDDTRHLLKVVFWLGVAVAAFLVLTGVWRP